MAKGQSGTIEYKEVTTDKPSWKPPAKEITAVMEPEKGEEEFVPRTIPYEPLVGMEPEPKKSVVIDIETTGVMPFDSRIICIAAASLMAPENIVVFYDKDEKKMLEKFINWFNGNGFNQIIGYNVAFDYRFLFAKAMRHRIKAPTFSEAGLYDLMNVMKQVKREFVFNFNKPGTLGEWVKYLFDREKLMTYEEILTAYEAGQIEPIINHCKNDVDLVLLLYTLDQYVRGEISG